MELLLTGIMALTVTMVLIWLLSLKLCDASVVDRFWGLLFIVVSITYALMSPDLPWRFLLALFLIALWGIRLSWHIHSRNRHEGEDPRYQRMRQHHGSSFWWYSLFSVFLLQGFIASIVSLPLFFLANSGSGLQLVWTDFLALAIWLAGFAFEAGGDWQLQKFKSDPQNKGKLLTTGLWSLTRHPNYFGDACIWWGFFLLTLPTAYGWLSIVSPILMTFMLRNVSGVKLLEKGMVKTKPGYDHYIATTPAFFPRLWRRGD